MQRQEFLAIGHSEKSSCIFKLFIKSAYFIKLINNLAVADGKTEILFCDNWRQYFNFAS